MRYEMLAATFCVAIALGACSGGGAPATGGPANGSEPTSGGEPTDGDNGAPNEGALNAARTAVGRVRAEIDAIETAARSATTAADLSAVRTRVNAARMAYADAVAAVQRLIDAAEPGSEARTIATNVLAGINVARPGDLDRLATALATAERGVVDTRAADRPRPNPIENEPAPVAAMFERFPRANDDGSVIPDTDRLSVQTGPVMHSAGKTVLSPQGAGATDELPARSITLRTTGEEFERGDWQIQGRDGTPDTTSNTDGVLEYSIQIKRDGLVYKARGNAIYYDFQRRFDVGDSVDAWFSLGPDGESGTDDDGAWSKGVDTPVNWVHDDVKLTFGTSTIHDGLNALYWNTRIPFPEGTTTGTPNVLQKLGGEGVALSNADLGYYELWISNFSGADGDQYLESAAYGLFAYTDEFSAPTGTKAPVRMQAFHFGYDTFADENNLRTTDIGASDTVEATFRGETMAYQYLTRTVGDLSRQPAISRPTRNEVRGDITMHASIGTGANTISGAVTNFRMRSSGSWVTLQELWGDNQRLVLASKTYATDADVTVSAPTSSEPTRTVTYWPEDYSAHGTGIGADGSYEGGVYMQNAYGPGESGYETGDPTGWILETGDWDPYNQSGGRSIFSGTIYGSRDSNFANIETAGYWYLMADPTARDIGGIVGSFGAVRTDTD